MLNVYFIKLCQWSYPSCIFIVLDKFSKSFNKTRGFGNTLNFIEINFKISEKMDVVQDACHLAGQPDKQNW